MAKVTISECQVIEPECAFGDPFQFRIRFNCIENLQEDLDWKIIYVGSANSNEHDQELDEMSTGPIPVGTHEFVLEASGPNPALIPAQEVVGVTVVLITCSYREQEFVRIGYYINNEYVTEEMKENPPDMPQIDQLKRLVCLNPRVTRMVINWDEKDENSMPSEAQTEETSEPTPFNFELSNSQSSAMDQFSRLEHCFRMKTPSQEANKPQERPPVFVENSMDCHNIQMSID